jgi:3D (Asp-Asp-Asp) domain-containing protein
MLLTSGCASSSVTRPPFPSVALDPSRAHTSAFAQVEDDAMGWLAAADPRLAMRADITPPDSVLRRIGTQAVLAEDTTAQIRGNSLDLFAFRARSQALDQAAKMIAGFRDLLPEVGPLGTELARPRLERELLERLVEEERTRAGDESKLGDASGELVRGIVSTWTAPAAPREWAERDAWASRHLLEIRDSLHDSEPVTGPSDLDVALYPLERLLAPMQFPRGSAAIAEIRMTLDADMRSVPRTEAPARMAHSAKVHLGLTVDPASLRPRLERIEERLRNLAEQGLDAAGAGRAEIEARARELLFVERSCPAVSDTRVRSMAPPPERAAVCGVLRALTEEGSQAPALVALHDDVLLSFAAVTTSRPSRTKLLSRPDETDVDTFERAAREHPIVAIGVALAAEIIYGAADGADERLRAWRALGEAPLDVVAREIGALHGPAAPAAVR